MNSIIWKGVASSTIGGLLISELPPITKPQMRIRETLIDGRDGSFIEELGYAPYDRQVSVGLHGNFDIDKVIKYFTGEGDIVFSNEPDKVYKARIVSQIDYQRLMRYRQATISFRCQPYKYKYNESASTFTSAFDIVNAGIESSKPKMTITGSGTIEISVNGNGVFSYTFPDGETQVVIDSELEDAYLGDSLKNRNMNGEFPILQSGTNSIAWTGTVESIQIEPRSRWI